MKKFFERYWPLLGVFCLTAAIVLILIISMDVTARRMAEKQPTPTACAGFTAMQMDYLEEASKLKSSSAAVIPVAEANTEDIVQQPIAQEEATPEEAPTYSVDDLTEGSVPTDPALDEDSDIQEVAGIIEAEAGGMSDFKELVAVGLSIYNRYDSAKYPNDIGGIIYAKYQFANPKKYTSRSLEAAKVAYTLWSDGRSEELLPKQYLYFFGWKGHNWYYNENYEIFEGLKPLPSGVYDAQKAIVPEL